MVWEWFEILKFNWVPSADSFNTVFYIAKIRTGCQETFYFIPDFSKQKFVVLGMSFNAHISFPYLSGVSVGLSDLSGPVWL